MHPNGTLYCSPFDGARVYSRGFYQQILHHTAWTPDGSYRQHDKLANAWVHPDHDGMVVWMPRTGTCVVLARPKVNPDLEPARKFSSFVFGPSRQPVGEVVFPPALRMPLRAKPMCTPPAPSQYCRCRPVAPAVQADATFVPYLVRLHGADVELRASVTSTAQGDSYFAEAFLGRPHVNIRGAHRAEFFPADARHALAGAPDWTASFISSALFRLLSFASSLDHLGLEVDATARLQLPEVASVELVPHVDDVMFDVKLPTAQGRLEFKAFSWERGYALAPAPGVPPVLPAVA